MLDYIVSCCILLALAVLSAIYILSGNTKRRGTIPGLNPTDNIHGNFPDVVAAGGIQLFLLELHRKYGPIAGFWWGPTYTVSIASPQLFKQHSKGFERPRELFALVEPLVGPRSIQYANGTDGRERHAAYSKCLSEEAMHQYFSTFHKLSDNLVSAWRTRPGDPIPLREAMFALTIKGVLRCNVGSYFDDENEITKIRQAYDCTWSMIEKSIGPDGTELDAERFEQQKEVLRSVMRKCMSERVRHEGEAEEFLLIDAIMGLHDDEETRIADTLSVLVAGFHTTGLMLMWSLYYMATNPEVQDRVYAECMQVLGEDRVSPDNINDLTYLQQVLDETLRCSNVAAYAARVNNVDIQLGGHNVPAETPVLHALSVVLMDPQLYPDPSRFDPDRFSDEAKKRRPGYSYEPFGFAGKRKCLGFRFGQTEARVVLAEVVRAFRVTLVEGQKVVPTYGVMATPKEEIYVTVEPRQ